MKQLAIRALAVVFLWTAAVCAYAQALPDFKAFDSLAKLVETDLQENRISDERFESLRSRLVDWREDFLDAGDVNASQIEALNAQIDALGPAPAEGATEPPDIAQRREELNTNLAQAREPRIRAEEAFARADTLIGEIDTTLRARQTDALFQLQRTPLDPSLWPSALTAAIGVVSEARTELTRNIELGIERGTLLDRLPVVLVLLALAVLLIVRGPDWIERFIASIENRTGEQGRIVYGFLVSLGAIAGPLIGISLINAALISTGLLGPTGTALALGINLAILAYAAGRWLGRRAFPESDRIPSPLRIDSETHVKGRRLGVFLGSLVGLLMLLEAVNQVKEFEIEKLGVLKLPIFFLLGLVLFRLGQILMMASRGQADDDSRKFVAYVLSLLARAVQVVAVFGPILAAVGYFRLAEAVLAPTAISLGLLALLTSLHYVIRATYGLIRRVSFEDASEALLPILVSFGLTLASLPLFALIWGARPTDIGEIWTTFRSGFRLGDTVVSPGAVLAFALVFGLGFLLTRLVQGTMRVSVLPRTNIDKGGQNAIVSGLGYLGLTLATVIGITSAGIDLSNLAIIVGALGVGIGFGLQNIVNNFVSGIILLIERPISEGDWVEVNGQMGTVRAISVRSTRIETFDRTDVIVPNGDLISGTVTNWTRGNSIGRVIVPVGVAYGTDTRKVETILKEIAMDHPVVAVNPPPQALFRGFGADSLDFEIRAILTDVTFVMNVHSDINHEIARRFAEENIEIPFAQRDIWLRNPEALKPLGDTYTGPRPPSDPLDPQLSAPDDGDGD